MKAYKKYGDIYCTTKQVRSLLNNHSHGSATNLRDFWVDRIQEILEADSTKDWDIIVSYCLMFYLSFVIEKRDMLDNWKMVVRCHRQMYIFKKP